MKKDKEKIKKAVGDRLKFVLYAKGLKTKEIAQELGVTPQAITAWFRGEKDPGFSKIVLLTEKYGINPLYLITGQGPLLLQIEGKNMIKAADQVLRKKKLRKTKNYCASAIAF